MRYVCVKLRNEGKKCSEIARITGISTAAISIWHKKYMNEGYEGLKIKKRGVKLGTGMKLDSDQINKIKEILIEKTPDQLGLKFSLWTRQAIQNLVLKLWSIYMPVRTVSDYMKRLGFTPQKPIKRAYQQDPRAVEKWLNETYPKIATDAMKENVEIHWLDETKVSSYSNYIRGYAPKGKTPLIKMKTKRMNLHIISTISKLGKMRFMTYKRSLNTKILIKFTRRLYRDTSKRIFLILDNLAVHHSHKFKNWLEKHKTKIRVFYLPSYSPELNPDERLNRDLKTHFHDGPLVKNKKEFRKKIVSFMKRKQNLKMHIKNYFNSKYVRYAA